MRIGIDIHCVGARQTGNETYVSNLVTALAHLDPPHDYFLYHTSPGAGAAGFRALLKSERADSVRIHKVWPAPPAFRIPLGFPLALARDRIDVSLFNYVTPPFSRRPAVVTVHDISYEHFPEYFHPLQRKRLQWLVPGSARRARHVLTVSEFSRRQIIEHYGLREDHVTATPLAASAIFKPLSDSAARESTSRFNLERPYLLGVSNLQPRKNLERLIQAYARLCARDGFDHDLVLVGQSAWRGHRIAAEAQRLGIESRVRLTGYVSAKELCALYQRAEVFVYPSTYEGFGLPILEAMAVGTPVITSRAASMPEVAGDAARLIDPYSVDDLTAAIDSVLGNPELRNRMRALGHEQCERFSWARTARQTLRVMEEAA